MSMQDLEQAIESATSYLLSVYWTEGKARVFVWRDLQKEKPWDDLAEQIIGDPTGDDEKIILYHHVASQIESRLKAKVIAVY